MSTAARQVKNIPKLYTTSVQRKHYLTVCIAEEEQLMTYKSMLFPECPSCCHQAFLKKFASTNQCASQLLHVQCVRFKQEMEMYVPSSSACSETRGQSNHSL